MFNLDTTPTVLVGATGTVRDLVAAVLSLQGVPVTVASDGDDALDAAVDTDSVLVLVSPGPEDWDTARRAARPVVLVSEVHLEADERLAAVLRGADAVVHTDASPVELADAVAAVRRGETLLDPLSARRLAAAARTGLVAQAELRLTPRELSILQSVERGESVKQTARSLGIAMKTVENLQSRMFRKLGARNRAHAVTIAHRLGLLDPVEPPATGLSA
ncbi:MAG: response regulator transcription factor [Actinomycetota bacterium]|jgi:two-component system, NarL family, nitrate/nitrite response regulator NarL